MTERYTGMFHASFRPVHYDEAKGEQHENVEKKRNKLQKLQKNRNAEL